LGTLVVCKHFKAF
jgi:hypothetical protein